MRPLLALVAVASVGIGATGADAAPKPTVTPAVALITLHAKNKGITYAQAKVELDSFFWHLSHPPVQPASGSGAAYAALRRNGASDYAARALVSICMRESHCSLHAHNYNRRTGDNSYGPWQINYYGRLRAGRTAAYGSGEYMTASWDRAARAVLSMSNNGRNLCPWRRSCYS